MGVIGEAAWQDWELAGWLADDGGWAAGVCWWTCRLGFAMSINYQGIPLGTWEDQCECEMVSRPRTVTVSTV